MAPDPRLLARLLDLGPVRMLTLAPELEGADELIAIATGRGVVVCAGHSDATFEVAYEALDASVAGVTHLFNAMSARPPRARSPGPPSPTRGSSAASSPMDSTSTPRWSPSPSACSAPTASVVTDAIEAAGMGDGEYRLATRTVYLEGGVPRLGSGAIAGSVLTMDEAFRNVLAFTDCTLPEAARMVSTTRASRRGGRRKAHNPRLRRRRGGGPDLSVEAVWLGGGVAYDKEGSSR